MLHEPVASSGPDYGAAYKTRLGVIMFVIYAIIYSGFVLINVLNAKVMETIVFAGLNLAVVYGFGLIIVAFLMAIFYNHMCTAKERQLAAEAKNGENN
jgi:uncharacterized membrane protein (DUF485 family)